MNILIVAPFHTELPLIPNEAAALRNALSGHLLQNIVTEQDLIDALRKGPYDGIWFATHGDHTGIWLSNEERLNAEALTQYIAAADAKWIFLNSCESSGLADTIRARTDADVIATNFRVPDETAWRTARLFAMALGRSSSIEQALARAAPDGAGSYRFWRNRVNTVTVQILDQFSHRLNSTNEAMYRIRRTLTWIFVWLLFNLVMYAFTMALFFVQYYG
jgi:hypothetical protein